MNLIGAQTNLAYANPSSFLIFLADLARKGWFNISVILFVLLRVTQHRYFRIMQASGDGLHWNIYLVSNCFNSTNFSPIAFVLMVDLTPKF